MDNDGCTFSINSMLHVLEDYFISFSGDGFVDDSHEDHVWLFPFGGTNKSFFHKTKDFPGFAMLKGGYSPHLVKFECLSHLPEGWSNCLSSICVISEYQSTLECGRILDAISMFSALGTLHCFG